MEQTVLGIDLAGVPTRRTGVCVLNGLQADARVVYTDEEILELAVRTQPVIITIDAPLSLPPGRETIEDHRGEHLRPCDRELQHRKIRFFPITLGPMRTLTKRGIVLKNELLHLDCQIFECYPGGAQDLLGIPRKQRGLDGLLSGLQQLGIQGLHAGLSHDELDAVTAAYVGKLCLEGNAELYGPPEDNVIMMPEV